MNSVSVFFYLAKNLTSFGENTKRFYNRAFGTCAFLIYTCVCVFAGYLRCSVIYIFIRLHIHIVQVYGVRTEDKII